MSETTSQQFSVESLMPTPEVQRWMQSAKLDVQPEQERVARVKVLADFCNRQGKNPPEMVAAVLRGGEEDGQYTLAIKGRRELDAAIDEFGDSLGLTEHQNITAGNVVRSFFIHNGVQMQGRPAL